jgi:hypothetical protein
MLTKMRCVLEHTHDAEGAHYFTDRPEPDQPSRKSVMLLDLDWVDMGRPEKIWVTIEPTDGVVMDLYYYSGWGEDLEDGV